MSDKKPIDPDLSQKRREAGKKGGATTKERHGRDHFAKIGAMGGAAQHDTPQAATIPQDTGSENTPE